MLSDLKHKDAYEILELLNIKESPIDVLSILQQIDVVFNTELKYDDPNIVEVNFESDSYQIWVNPLDSKNRQRLALAHCLCRILYDDKNFSINNKTLIRHPLGDCLVYKSNLFAETLLMPSGMIIYEMGLLIDSYKKEFNMKIPRKLLIDKMAEKFIVSKQNMERRINYLVSINS